MKPVPAGSSGPGLATRNGDFFNLPPGGRPGALGGDCGRKNMGVAELSGESGEVLFSALGRQIASGNARGEERRRAENNGEERRRAERFLGFPMRFSALLRSLRSDSGDSCCRETPSHVELEELGMGGGVFFHQMGACHSLGQCRL